jgi:hypothetical protein
MLLKLVTTAIALGSIAWAYSFLRSAIVTLRTGRPFFVHAHRGGSMPLQAGFGRLGAVVITCVVIGIAYACVRVALAFWGVGGSVSG